MKKSIKVLLGIILSGASLVGVTSCNNEQSDKTKVTIGVCGTSNDYWKLFNTF